MRKARIAVLTLVLALAMILLVGTSAWAQTGGSTPPPTQPATGGNSTPAASNSSSSSSSGSAGSSSSSGTSGTSSGKTGAELWLFAGLGASLIGAGYAVNRRAARRQR